MRLSDKKLKYKSVSVNFIDNYINLIIDGTYINKRNIIRTGKKYKTKSNKKLERNQNWPVTCIIIKDKRE